VPNDVLNARGTWSDPAAYDAQAQRLAEMFRRNMEKFGDAVPHTIRDAGPT